MKIPTPEDIARDVFVRFIDCKTVVNVFRAGHVEAMVLRALGGGYVLTDGWEGWDLTHKDTGWRLEIKQAAAKQVWKSKPKKTRHASFDIAPRKWEFSGDDWVKLDPPRRLAAAYVFAWHGDTSDACDHRDPAQWEFFVAPTTSLKPDQKTISRSSLKGAWMKWDELAPAVEAMRTACAQRVAE